VGHYRVTIQEAAKRLGVKEAAIRKRIERGTLEKEKDEDGRVYVFVDKPPAEERDTAHDEGYDSSYFAGYDALIKSHQERIEDLREQLSAERRANEENRRIIAALTQRIPELEAPREQALSQEPPGSPETASGPPDRGDVPPATGGAQEAGERVSWWRRMFGG
jgi:predicted ArsR family transcriptional regulator